MTALRKSKIAELIEFDRKYLKNSILIGTDEAGRGPVAGPVVAAAVCFKDFGKNTIEAIKYLDDSKRFGTNHKARKELADEIVKHCYYSIQECSVQEIEKYNILQASLLAMKKACNDVINQISNDIGLVKNPKILVDGRIKIPDYNIEQEGIIKGDSKSASVAAASILAKVHRDEFMMELATRFPEYDWHKNKGYPTKVHLRVIQEKGITEWHRKSFLTKYI